MYKNRDEMFDGIIKNLKKNIKRVEESTSVAQRKGVVGSIQKLNTEIEQLIFGIELDNVSKAEQEARAKVEEAQPEG